MSDSRPDLQAAFILHSRPYRDTSLIIDTLCRDHGRLSMVVKGARGPRSRWQGRLQPFRPLLLSWRGRSELVTLTDLETQGNSIPLQGMAMMSGFYLNELLQRLLHPHDPHPELFDYYHLTLQRMAEQPIQLEATLRYFECQLLEELGYGLNLESECEQGEAIRSDADYCYHLQQGARLRAGQCSGIAVSGATLLALAGQQALDSSHLVEAKRLLRAVIQLHLGDKPLKTRDMLKRTHNLMNSKSEGP